MDSADTRIAKGDARKVARHNHLAHTVEAVVGTLVSYLLEDRDDDLPRSFAKDGGVGIALRRKEGLYSMYQRIDGAACVKLEGQPPQQLRYDDRIVSYDGIVSESHLRLAALDLSDGDIGHLATCTAGCGDDDELLLLDEWYLLIKSVHHVCQAT